MKKMRHVSVRSSSWLLLAAVALVVAATPAQAQRDSQPPRTAAGKPDFSGVWRVINNKYLRNLAADSIPVPFTPTAAALYNERRRNNGKGKPSDRCLPRGVPAALLVRDHPWKIVQTPGVLLMLFDES